MATKTVKAKESEAKYIAAVGRRKTAVAQVRITPVADEKDATLIVNGREAKKYFGTDAYTNNAFLPLKTVGMEGKWSVSVLAQGGGVHGQSDATKLGVARALVKSDLALRPLLKAEKLLTRDARAVERKKPGLKKARRAPQWSKR